MWITQHAVRSIYAIKCFIIFVYFPLRHSFEVRDTLLILRFFCPLFSFFFPLNILFAFYYFNFNTSRLLAIPQFVIRVFFLFCSFLNCSGFQSFEFIQAGARSQCEFLLFTYRSKISACEKPNERLYCCGKVYVKPSFKCKCCGHCCTLIVCLWVYFV